MTIKQVFPKMLLVLGVVSILLASMPTGVVADILDFGETSEVGDPLGAPSDGWDQQAWEDAGWTVKTNENDDTGNIYITRTHPADDTTNGDQWETKIHYDGKTGEYEEERIVIHPDGSTHSSGYEGTDPTHTHKTSDTDITTDGRKTTTAYRPDGSQSSVVAWDGTGRKYADNEYDANGNMTSSESWDADGTHYKNTFDANGHMISSEKTGPDGTKTVTTYGPAGDSYTVTTDPKGHVTSEEKSDGYGNIKIATFAGDCVMDPRIGHFGQIIKGPGCHRTTLTSFESKTGKDEVIRYDENGNVISDTGGKDQIKADVLGQIEGKPNGDLMDDKTQLPAAMTQQPGKGNASVQPMPIGALPVGKSGISSVISGGQSTGKVFQSGVSAEKKLPAGVLGHIDKTGAKAVELNPQPLPPGPPPPPDKLGGKVQFDKKKLQTDALQRFKDKIKIQDSSVSQKSKWGVKTGSQSASQTYKINAANKLKFQTQAVQQNKFKLNHRRWGTSAGSSEAFRAPK